MDEIRKELIEMYEQLSEEDKAGVSWLITNIDIAEELSKGKPIPAKEMERLMKKAQEKDDKNLFMLLAYKEQYDKDKSKQNKSKQGTQVKGSNNIENNK